MYFMHIIYVVKHSFENQTGISFGAEKPVNGEVVFSTGMVGYTESLTDPSFRGQVVCCSIVVRYSIIQYYPFEYIYIHTYISDTVDVFSSRVLYFQPYTCTYYYSTSQLIFFPLLNFSCMYGVDSYIDLPYGWKLRSPISHKVGQVWLVTSIRKQQHTRIGLTRSGN